MNEWQFDVLVGITETHLIYNLQIDGSECVMNKSVMS